MKDNNLVSFCIVAYNQEEYIADAVKSALEQTYSPMEIIISDDCSTDNTFEVIKKTVEAYKGPNKIVLNRNEKNMGISKHCNKVIYDLCQGDIILLLGGDDVFAPNMAEVYVKYFNRFPEVMSMSCESVEVDENLKEIPVHSKEWDNSFSIYNINDYLEHRNFIIYSGDSRALRRDVVTSFPPLEFAKSEDLSLFVRSLLIGSGCIVREPLVKRRHHGNNASAKKGVSYEPVRRQMYEDIQYAYNRKYITKLQKEKMEKKADYIKEQFELYWDSSTRSIKTIFYRVLRKIFGVTK